MPGTGGCTYTTSTGAEVVRKEAKQLEKKGLDLTAATRLSDLLDRIAEGRALPGDVKPVTRKLPPQAIDVASSRLADWRRREGDE